MKRLALLCAAVSITSSAAFAAETPQSLVATYDSLADAILAVKQAEADFVRSVLDAHHRAAAAAMQRGDHEAAAAEIALFANEGDNAIGGVRKRLLEGGHHHHADAEAQGEYEPGFVIVSAAAKQRLLAAAKDLRAAGDEQARQTAWKAFETVATELLPSL